jgi:hypothetical protein
MPRMLVADRDRERGAAALREHYVHGRLTLEEYSRRSDRVLAARTELELRAALTGLPPSAQPAELMRRARSAVRAAARRAALVALTGVYVVLTLALVLVVAVLALVGDESATGLALALVVWAIPAGLLYRAWHRPELPWSS